MTNRIEFRRTLMKLKSLVLVFLFLFLFISPSFSQPPDKRHGPEMGRMHRRGELPCPRASDLNLSSDQVKELELIQQSFYREASPIRTELFSKYLELKEFLTDPIIKIESIHAKNAEIILLQSKLEERAIHYLIKVRALLTQEQLRIWCPEQEFFHSRRMMPGPGPMGPMGPPRPYPKEEPRKE
jgi:Heavy-metal resistance